jgi:putative hemolysin
METSPVNATSPESTASSGFTRIDIGELLHRYKPKIARWLPKGMIGALEKLVHIELINDFLEEHYNDEATAFLKSAAAWMDIELTVAHAERLRESLGGRPIIVANHPLGGPESVLLMHEIAKLRPDLRMVSQELLLKLKPLAPLLAPIPKQNGRSYSGALMEAFQSERPLLLFPAGYCSRPLSFGAVYDYAWQKMFVKVARKHGRPIVPIHISGMNSKKFYRLSGLRRGLGIKASLESVYLVDEMVKQRGNSLTMTIGTPIAFEALDRAVTDEEWANRIRQYVYNLGRNPALGFDPGLPATLPLR